MNPIRPSIQPPLPQAQGSGQRLQGESALFALARAKMAAAQPAAETAIAPAAPAVQKVSSTPPEPPQKILRPGSLIDIRV